MSVYVGPGEGGTQPFVLRDRASCYDIDQATAPNHTTALHCPTHPIPLSDHTPTPSPYPLTPPFTLHTPSPRRWLLLTPSPTCHLPKHNALTPNTPPLTPSIPFHHPPYPPPQMAVADTITNLPWAVKPLYGFITDSFPIAGMRRRPYLILAGLLGERALGGGGIAVGNGACRHKR